MTPRRRTEREEGKLNRSIHLQILYEVRIFPDLFDAKLFPDDHENTVFESLARKAACSFRPPRWRLPRARFVADLGKPGCGFARLRMTKEPPFLLHPFKPVEDVTNSVHLLGIRAGDFASELFFEGHH